jgi:aldehyde:ferredoxin oxidoreductase
MTGGYAGKILRVNLTNGRISSIPTSKYEEYGGGYGVGAAIFCNWMFATGYPKRSTLEKLGPGHVADVLQTNKKPGV